MAQEPQIEIREYVDAQGKNPYRDWFSNLKDPHGVARIQTTLDRITYGNLTSLKALKRYPELFEIKFKGTGPGYRVYCAWEGSKLIIVLGAGIKKAQTKDIGKAWERWNEYKQRKQADRSQ